MNEEIEKGKHHNSNMRSIAIIIVICIIGAFIFKGLTGIYHLITDITDSKGISLARNYLENDERNSYYNLYIDTSYRIGKIKYYDNSSIVESDGDKYIFKVTVYYNPKLNNGSTDLTKEDVGTTYVVYNKKSGKYICCKTLETAKNTDVWKNN